jgi:hypothetical protein
MHFQLELIKDANFQSFQSLGNQKLASKVVAKRIELSLGGRGGFGSLKW